jgi:hypothetical protein
MFSVSKTANYLIGVIVIMVISYVGTLYKQSFETMNNDEYVNVSAERQSAIHSINRNSGFTRNTSITLGTGRVSGLIKPAIHYA